MLVFRHAKNSQNKAPQQINYRSVGLGTQPRWPTVLQEHMHHLLMHFKKAVAKLEGKHFTSRSPVSLYSSLYYPNLLFIPYAWLIFAIRKFVMKYFMPTYKTFSLVLATQCEWETESSLSEVWWGILEEFFSVVPKSKHCQTSFHIWPAHANPKASCNHYLLLTSVHADD